MRALDEAAVTPEDPLEQGAVRTSCHAFMLQGVDRAGSGMHEARRFPRTFAGLS